MVDLHCHILPGLDDGPATMEESMGMAESAIADGITHLVATPHPSNRYSFDFARVRQLRDELQAKAGDRLKIATGCDFISIRRISNRCTRMPHTIASTSMSSCFWSSASFPSRLRWTRRCTRFSLPACSP